MPTGMGLQTFKNWGVVTMSWLAITIVLPPRMTAAVISVHAPAALWKRHAILMRMPRSLTIADASIQ